MKKSLLILLPLAVAFTDALGNITLPPLISDNMLLESTKAVVWGKADPGENVTVKLGKSIATATADKDGRWSVMLVGLKPGTPGEMTVTGKNNLTIKNVAVGDVWVASGQSNMEMMLKCGWLPSGGVLNFEQEIAAANHPDIRMFTVPKGASETPVEDLSGKWEVCTPEVAPHFSAVGYFFARKLNQDLKLPIGIIHTSWGGTTVQAWTPTDVIQGDPEFQTVYFDPRQKDLANIVELKAKFTNETLPAWQAKADAAKAAGQPIPRKPTPPYGPGEGPTVSALYNKMIRGATPYGIKGAIWYQGESNAWPVEAERYRRLLSGMITSWRKAWTQPDFPFYIVQLANFQTVAPQPEDHPWARLREAQRLTAETLPHSGLAVIIDIGEEKSVHPVNKQEVGRRLALIAEAKTYGNPVVYSGPAFEKVQFESNTAKITFKPGTAAGLKAADGTPIKGFAIAGEDQKFVWADAKLEAAPIEKTKSKAKKASGKATPVEQIVVLTAPGVEKPVAVRYAWASNPVVNLVNEAGLPVVPFRTDGWPYVNPPTPKPFTPPTPVATATPAEPTTMATPAASPAAAPAK